MRSFTYSGIRRDYFEGTRCSSPLGEASFSLSRLISVVFCTPLEWFAWCLCPSWRSTSPVEGLGVSDMASVTCIDAGYSAMPLGAAWVSDPWGKSWGPGYRYSSFQASLGRGMLDDLLRCHYFLRVDFSCVASSDCSSTRFFQFIGTFPLLMCSTVENVSLNATWYWV